MADWSENALIDPIVAATVLLGVVLAAVLAVAV